MADPDTTGPSGAVDSPARFGKPPSGIAARWITEIREGLEARKKWKDQVRKVLKRYLDERSPQLNESQKRARFNILWSNVNTLVPALYSRMPKPEVERRQKDGDPIGRAAAQILERALRVELDDDFDESMRRSVFDYVTGGQGVAWVRYEPEFATDPVTGEKVIIEEDCEPDYVHWDDFLTNPARVWDEVRWGARQHFWTRQQMRDMGFADWETIPLNWNAKQAKSGDKRQSEAEDDVFMKAACWEIWDSEAKQRIYINVDWPTGPLKDPEPDPLGLEDFFPFPKPLLATTSNDSIVPVPDYILYEDQAAQLDKLTQRLDSMVAACRTTGVYDKSFPELARLPTAGDNKLYPVDNWDRFAKANGFMGTMAMLPIDPIIKAIEVLSGAKQAAKADLYEITGISDIIRGESDPNETATAQNIKGQFATLRLRDRQAEITRFGRDLIRIMAQVICNKFQPQTILKMASVDVSSDPNTQQAAAQAIALLKNHALREFRIDIESDSMVVVDEQAEKQARGEFLTASGTFLENGLASLAKIPPQIAGPLVPLMMEMLLFGVRGFKAGRDLETSFETAKQQIIGAIQQMQQQAQMAAQQPPPPNPDVVKAQIDQQRGAQEMRQSAEAHAQQMAQDQAQFQQKMQQKVVGAAVDAMTQPPEPYPQPQGMIQ